jgi:hypothetical protein
VKLRYYLTQGCGVTETVAISLSLQAARQLADRPFMTSSGKQLWLSKMENLFTSEGGRVRAWTSLQAEGEVEQGLYYV